MPAALGSCSSSGPPDHHMIWLSIASCDGNRERSSQPSGSTAVATEHRLQWVHGGSLIPCLKSLRRFGLASSGRAIPTISHCPVLNASSMESRRWKPVGDHRQADGLLEGAGIVGIYRRLVLPPEAKDSANDSSRQHVEQHGPNVGLCAEMAGRIA